MLTFAFPALLGGALAAGLPWLIHLILRPRPQRVRFPAVTLLRPVLIAGRRASKLRNLWLLLIRTLVIVLLAALLAAPACRTSGAAVGRSGPIANLIVFDDSLSMTYRYDERTLSQIAQDQLGQLLSEPRVLETTSDWAIVFAGDQDPAAPLSPDISDITRTFYAHAALPHARPLGEALRRAAAMLRQAPQPRKRLHIFTDLSASAWSDVPRGLFDDVPGIHVTVSAATSAPRSNIAIRRVEGTGRIHPARAPVVLRASVSAYAAPARCRIVVRRADSVLARSEISPVTADASHEYVLPLSPMPAGPHGLSVALDPDDRLSFDGTHYAAIQTGPRPAALLLVSNASDVDTDLTAMIVRNLIAPLSLDETQQPLEFHVVTPSTLSEHLRNRPTLVIAPGRAEMSTDSRRALLRAVERGAQLMLLPASRGDGAIPDALRALFTAAPLTSRVGQVTTMIWEPSSPFAESDEGLAELTRCAVRRRLIVERPLDGVLVHGRYADGSPALLSRSRGHGAIWLLTTSPDPKWSDLGTRAAGLITLFFGLIDRAAGLPDLAANFTAHQQSRRIFTGLRPDGLLRVSRMGDPASESTWLRLTHGLPDRDWPTDSAGLYGIRTAGKSQPSAIYAVNWPAAESDTTPITLDQITAILGTSAVDQRLDSQPDAARSATALARLSRLIPPEPAAAVLIVLLFITELLLGNRRRPATT